MSLERVSHNEYEPSDETFRFVLSAVRGRLTDAVREHRKLAPDYAVFTLDSLSTEVPDTVAKFILADNRHAYDFLAAETLELGVPVDPQVNGAEGPQPLAGEDGDYFVLYRRHEDYPQEIVVDAVSAPDILFSDQPVVADFMQKVLTYEVVPFRKINRA